MQLLRAPRQFDHTASNEGRLIGTKKAHDFPDILRLRTDTTFPVRRVLGSIDRLPKCSVRR